MTDPLLDLYRLEGVPSAVAAAVAAADAVLRDRGARTVPTEMTARALLADARASAAMEGTQWEPGAIRLSTELLSLAAMIRKVPAQVLARAHLLLARGVLPDDQLGQLPADDPARLTGTLEVLRRPTAAPSLVVAAVAHAEIVSLAPPGGGHGVVARAVEHLVLIEAGVDPRGVLLVAEGHRAAGAAYREGLVGYATGTTAGVRDWLLHCAQAVTYGAEVSPLGAVHKKPGT